VVSLVGGVVSLAERIAPDIQEVIERPAEENLDRRSAYERRCVVRPAQPAMLFIDCCDELPKIPEKPEHSRDAHEDVGFERQAFLRLRGLGTMSKLVLRRGSEEPNLLLLGKSSTQRHDNADSSRPRAAACVRRLGLRGYRNVCGHRAALPTIGERADAPAPSHEQGNSRHEPEPHDYERPHDHTL
jgi:hypothetical protein